MNAPAQLLRCSLLVLTLALHLGCGTPELFTPTEELEVGTEAEAGLTSVRVTPIADAWVDEARPSFNFGTASELAVDGSPRQRAFLRFNVTAVAGSVQKATLRLYVTNPGKGPSVWATSAGWTESTLTWANQPASVGPGLSSLPQTATGTWVSFDVTTAAMGNGSYNFLISSSETDGTFFASRESAHPPQLILSFSTPDAGSIPLDAGITPEVDAGIPVPDAGVIVPDAGTPYPTDAGSRVVLPLEVIGADGYTVTARFSLTDATGITQLFIQGNRLGYEQGLSTKSGQAKASVSINGGAFLPITAATASVLEPEKTYGGIGGGFHTIRLTLPVTGLRAGANAIDFKFNGTDGMTSGYRVVSFNLLRAGSLVLPASAFIEEDPSTWTAPRPAEAAQGRTLWTKENALTLPNGGGSLRTSCSACHSEDGRDLKYFNFSNWSIIQRSVFHGLTQVEGEQIASYIRSLNTPAPAMARPWNPPYQPGPGLDARPAEQWAAGAGLSAVLASDGDMLPFFTAIGPWTTVASTSGTLNLREMPVALQFPDWNAWLPVHHPLNVWGDTFKNGPANQAYLKLRTDLPALVANPGPTLAARVGDLDDGVRSFIGAGRTDTIGQGPWRTQNGTNVNNVPASVGIERAKLGLAQWMAVKHWEVVQQFNLETLPAKVFPPSAGVVRGEVRGWPSSGQSVWSNAPHMAADTLRAFAGQSMLLGAYLSSVWYQLQMTLNPGMRQHVDTTPVDWQYHFSFLRHLEEESGRSQVLRFHQSMIKATQMRDNGLGPTSLGFQLRYLHPSQVFADATGSTVFFDALDSYQPGLRNAVLEAELLSFLGQVKKPEYALATWPRRVATLYDNSTHSYWYALETTSFVPTAYSGAGEVFTQPDYNHANSFYRLLPRLKARGISLATRQQLVNFCKAAWPAGAWDGLL